MLFRAAILVMERCGFTSLNLSCERNAFQGSNGLIRVDVDISVLISLARGMLFRGVYRNAKKEYEAIVLISLARGMLFRVC